MQCTGTTRSGRRCRIQLGYSPPFCGNHYAEPLNNLFADVEAERDRAEDRAWARLLRAEDGGS